MTYLVAQIWLFLLAASIVGLIVGALLSAAAGGARVRDLRRKLEEVEVGASQTRDEAARLSAQIQRRGGGEDDAERIRALERELEAANREARRAQEVADREAARAGELQARVVEAEAGAGESARASGLVLPHDEGRGGELAEARAEIEALNRRLAEAEPALTELALLRDRVGELEAGASPEQGSGEARADNERLRARVDELEHALAARAGAANDGEAEALRARVAELEASLAGARAAETDASLDIDPPEGEAPGDSASALAHLRWRNRYLDSRVTYLESKMAEAGTNPAVASLERELETLRARNEALERRVTAGGDNGLSVGQVDELIRLREKVAGLENASPADGAEAVARTADVKGPESAREGFSLEWRNRYLASRVRYLEGRLEEALEETKPAEPSVDEDELNRLRRQVAGFQAQSDEIARLRARLNEYEAGGGPVGGGEGERLRMRIAELERALAERDGDDAPLRGEAAHALEWRNRYLTSRVKYLEERLAGGGENGSTSEA